MRIRPPPADPVREEFRAALARLESLAATAIAHRRPEPDAAGAEASYRALVEQIPAVTFQARLTEDSPTGPSEIYVSPQIEELLGYEPEAWRSNPVLWYERLHPEDRGTLHREFARGCAADGRFRAECRFLARDGRVVWIRGEARLYFDEAGVPRLLHGVAFDVTESKRAAEGLERTIREKEVLIQEVHHRVKNNLQITSSLLRLQGARIEDPSARQALQASRDRIHSMALVHEMLYRSGDFARIDFREYARKMTAYLFRSSATPLDRIRRVENFQPIELEVEEAISCGLVLNELVTNALKHAFPGDVAGTIEVAFAREGDQLVLTVADDGVGLPPGLDPANLATLGLELVRNLARQLRGEIRFEGGPGTRVRLSFPERER